MFIEKTPGGHELKNPSGNNATGVQCNNPTAANTQLTVVPGVSTSALSRMRFRIKRRSQQFKDCSFGTTASNGTTTPRVRVIYSVLDRNCKLIA